MDIQKTWYVLFVRSQDEYKVCKYLCEFHLNAFVPKMKVLHRKNGVKTLVEKMMFPNYVFVESELEQNEFVDQLNLLKKRGLQSIKLLKFDHLGTPALRPEEMLYLSRLLNEEKVMDHSIGIIEGGKTIITEGPLKGMENTIIKIDRHKRRALIELMICNQPTRVNVSLEIISKI